MPIVDALGEMNFSVRGFPFTGINNAINAGEMNFSVRGFPYVSVFPVAGGSSPIKTINGINLSNLKTLNGITKSALKTFNGVNL